MIGLDKRRKLWRVGFYVEVEVEAFDGEAALMAEAACHWPGSWSPPHEPTLSSGRINNRLVTARILRSQPLMVKPTEAPA